MIFASEIKNSWEIPPREREPFMPGIGRRRYKTRAAAQTIRMEVSQMEKFRSGEIVPMSCNYKAYDKNGQSHDNEKTYLEKGTTFPPLQHEGGYWVMDHN